jgi:transposase
MPPDLSREEMWDMICELREQLSAALQRMAELEAQLAKPKKTARNSSVPPSQTHKGKRKPPGKKRGGKPGHKGQSRTNTTPDQIVECRPTVCPHCGDDVDQTGQTLLRSHQVVDIPPVEPRVIEWQCYGVRCDCGHFVEGRYPEGYDDPQQDFGPGVHSLLSYFNGTHHVSHNRLRQMMGDIFGVTISAGAIVNSLQRTARKLSKPAYDILRDIRRSTVIGSDETGFRVEGSNWWMWVLQTLQASYFAVADTRAGDVLEALMFDAVAEIWCCDLYSAQLNAPARRFAICNAHQLRNLQYAIDAGDDVFAPAMHWLLLEGLALARSRHRLPPEAYRRALEAVKATCLELLKLPTEHKDALRLQKRYRKHHEKLWLFLEHEDVPFTNNASERALRPAVIHRKVIGSFRSEEGACAYALYRTIEDTARKRGQTILDALYAVLGRPVAPHQVCFSSL